MACLLAPWWAPAPAAEAPQLHTLIVGGGPSPSSNAAQIEGHVRYVAGLLPKSDPRSLLFADGRRNKQTVSYSDPSPRGLACRALGVLLPDHELPSYLLYREPSLGVPVDGPSNRPALHKALTRLWPRADRNAPPLLLFFAGHGATNGELDRDTEYDLWGGKTLAVHELAAELARAPKEVPLVLVMVQCYSGAFANLLFRDGNEQADLALPQLVGFFAARRDREASGCGWDTGEDDYQDFSSYFFGALSGVDRFGKPVSGADADGDGRVSLHEGFCYALGHDPSSDTPVCTSDAFLRRFAPMQEAKACAAPYPEVWDAASPAQRAALQGLGEALHLTGDQQALVAYDRLTFRDPIASPDLVQTLRRQTDGRNELRQQTLTEFFTTWPALRDRILPGYPAAEEAALKALEARPALCRDLLQASRAFEVAEGATESEEAKLRRYVDLYTSVVLAKTLRANQKAPMLPAFERLWRAEQRVLPLAAP